MFLFLFALSSLWVGVSFAWDPWSAWEFKLTADDLVPAGDFGRTVAIEGNLVAVGAGSANAGSLDTLVL